MNSNSCPFDVTHLKFLKNKIYIYRFNSFEIVVPISLALWVSIEAWKVRVMMYCVHVRHLPSRYRVIVLSSPVSPVLYYIIPPYEWDVIRVKLAIDDFKVQFVFQSLLDHLNQFCVFHLSGLYTGIFYDILVRHQRFIIKMKCKHNYNVYCLLSRIFIFAFVGPLKRNRSLYIDTFALVITHEDNPSQISS